MGVNSSSLNELSSNEYLRRLSGSDPISYNDPFWNQLLSFTFAVPRNTNDQRQLEESTGNVCKNFAINNCRTGNFGSLVHVFLLRAAELETSAQCEDNLFTWQTYNALFVLRNLCKYFVENLTEEVVVQQFEAKSPDALPNGVKGSGDDRLLMEEFVECLMRILVQLPVVYVKNIKLQSENLLELAKGDDVTYATHLECVNTLLTLLSIQLFQSVPTASDSSCLYRCIMEPKDCTVAPALVETLLHNYVIQLKHPVILNGSQSQHGRLYGLTSAVASGLWTVVTLGLASSNSTKRDDELNDAPLANQSLLLLLVLTNHCQSEGVDKNIYCKAFMSCVDLQHCAAARLPTTDSSACLEVRDVKVVFGDLYRTICHTLKDEQTTLFLYMLLHRVDSIKAYILSRCTNIDQLVMPILKILYNTQDGGSSHHIYMALIVILILSEDACYSKAVHETTLKNVVWFKERQVGEITLGGLLILVLVRTIQYNMARMRDQYLHTNCLAALANMSAQFTNLHPYVAQRLVSLFELLIKKHTRAVNRLRESASNGHASNGGIEGGVESGSESEHEVDNLQELAVLEEVMRMTLEILNSCLVNSLHHNPNLIYTMLYKRSLFTALRTHATFQDIIQNIDMVLSYFSSRLEQIGSSLSVSEVHAVIKQGAMQFKRERLKKFPELKFRYVEEERPEEFFIPYVWSLVYHGSNLYFNPTRVQLFTVQSNIAT